MNKDKPRKTFKLRINGDTWTVKLYSPTNWPKYLKYALALTFYNHTDHIHEILFLGPKVSKSTIVHELCHVYMARRFGMEEKLARFKPGTVEELMCEMVGEKFRTLSRLSNRINKLLHAA